MRKSDKFAWMNPPQFWMGGRLATDLIAVTNDPKDIDDGFWAITTTFDGRFTGAKFSNLQECNWNEPYKPLKRKVWNSSHSRERLLRNGR
jgi:hypothetical protein